MSPISWEVIIAELLPDDMPNEPQSSASDSVPLCPLALSLPAIHQGVSRVAVSGSVALSLPAVHQGVSRVAVSGSGGVVIKSLSWLSCKY